MEIDLSQGLYCFSIVGLADKAVEESKERVSAAIKNSGFNSPQKKQQRIVISLAPADLKKEGPVFDLAIALAYILASDQADFIADNRLFLGELALDGTIMPIKGALILTRTAKELGFKEVFLPKENAAEASLIKGVNIFGCSSLNDILDHLTDNVRIAVQPAASFNSLAKYDDNNMIDFADIRGQENAKRGLIIAASGGHNVAMSGPPGTGKTILAKAAASILPPPTFEEALEIISISSVAGNLPKDFFVQRPFRNPHHTASYVSLIGGGAWPKPGEITLAHRGILFLDEFPEFERRVIEALRQPLEDGIITVTRIKDTLQFPAKVMLIVAMNPCPCGNLGSKNKMCLCSPVGIFRYQRKISGPIADRIDLWIEVPQVDYEILGGAPQGVDSKTVRKLIAAAREIQKKRFSGQSGKSGNSRILTNSEMSVKDLDKFVPLSSSGRLMLNQAASHMDLSPRSYHRVIKIARTIADLENEEEVKESHISEAIQYRPKQSGRF